MQKEACMSEELSELTGRVSHIVFRNEENFYTVMKVKLQNETEKSITMTGIIPSIETDVLYHFYGTYQEHPRYGMQYAVASFERILPTEEEGIIRYFSSVQFPGIGKRTAKKIVSALGNDAIAKIKENPDILKNAGLGDDKINIIKEGISKEEDGLGELVKFLNVHGLGVRNLMRLRRTYGKEAMSKISENPYRVIEECDGFGFKTADAIAMSLHFSEDDPRRLYAALVSICMDLCVKNGDSYVLESELEQKFSAGMAGLHYDFGLLLNQACEKRSLVREERRVYPVSQYDAESYIASFLSSFPFVSLDPVDPELLDKYIRNLQKDLSITYDEQQIAAVNSLFMDPFLIITGGPGTGKTTVVQAMVKLFRLLYPDSRVFCAAPTGRAAKRMAEMTGTDATTIHSLLKWDLETNSFGVNEQEPLEADVLIVDEFSMVDTWLFSNLLRACRKVNRICVIGDEDQLPSVSPGSVLRDLIASEQFPLIRLSHIYRQKEGSDVITLAHQIHDGTVDFSVLEHDVRFYPCHLTEIKSNIIRIVQSALERGYDLNDIQVLSPMYSGSAGIDVLNKALQDTFNPWTPKLRQIRNGWLTLREHDKILQLKNQPEDNVYNGDIGFLEEVLDKSETETHEPEAVVRFEDNYVEYTPDNFGNITLAYCISVHKSQGSEYPIVILPMTRQFSIMLQRRLIYTAVTRARQSLIIIGDEDAFRMAVSAKERRIRSTTLEQRIRKSFDFQA